MKEFDPVEEVIEAVRGGKIVVVMDDEDRENEGDVICAAEFATPENVNFMASYAKGLNLYAYARRLCGKTWSGYDVLSEYR